MGYVKQATIEYQGANQDLAQALTSADGALERLLEIGLLNAADRQQYEGWQVSILAMLGSLLETGRADREDGEQ